MSKELGSKMSPVKKEDQQNSDMASWLVGSCWVIISGSSPFVPLKRRPDNGVEIELFFSVVVAAGYDEKLQDPRCRAESPGRRSASASRLLHKTMHVLPEPPRSFLR
jgi:hypothetical protein